MKIKELMNFLEKAIITEHTEIIFMTDDDLPVEEYSCSYFGVNLEDADKNKVCGLYLKRMKDETNE